MRAVKLGELILGPCQGSLGLRYWVGADVSTPKSKTQGSKLCAALLWKPVATSPSDQISNLKPLSRNRAGKMHGGKDLQDDHGGRPCCGRKVSCRGRHMLLWCRLIARKVLPKQSQILQCLNLFYPTLVGPEGAVCHKLWRSCTSFALE